MTATLDRLEAVIAERKTAADPSTSHTARLLAKGPAAAAQKVGEEAVETVIALVSGDREAIASEAADLVYHLAVALAARGMTLADVYAELDRRHGVSGLAEKAARSDG